MAVLVFALLAGWGIASLQAYERQQQALRDQRDAASQAAAIQKAAAQAGSVLEVLDAACVPPVQELCLDEIFCHRRPVLIGVEPHSMTWVLGQRADDRRGETWRQALQPWTGLESVVCDAGSGLQAGLDLFEQAAQFVGGHCGNLRGPAGCLTPRHGPPIILVLVPGPVV